MGLRLVAIEQLELARACLRAQVLEHGHDGALTDIQVFLSDDKKSLCVFSHYHYDPPAYSYVDLQRELASEDLDEFREQVELVRAYMTTPMVLH
jgi:hypothetical protein